MKFTSLKQLKAPGTELAPTLAPGSDDFLSRVNQTITNFRELIKLVKEARGVQSEVNENEDTSPTPGPGLNPGSGPGPGLNKGSIVKFLDVAVQQGYGSKTLGEVIEEAKPFTLKQVLEFLKHAGL